MFGYRSFEVETLAPVWPTHQHDSKEITLDPSVKIVSYRQNDRNLRRPVAGSLGVHLAGACLPHPDLSDSQTTLEGALYRFCPKIPGYDEHKEDFKEFVTGWVKEKLIPLAATCDTSQESWLTKTNYTVKRKEELLQKYRNVMNKFDRAHQRVKSFIKDEFYPEFKHARAINSRADEFKTLTGPIFQLISDSVFSLPEFIKKIPIADRPDEIMKLYQEGGKYFTGDFSSFEAHFRQVVMEDCEFVLYDYMTQYLPEHDEFMKLVRDVIGGKNRITFKNVIMEVDAKRMSGEMNTSLGNGFSNLMFILYICSKNPSVGTVIAKIEGDDSICSCSGTPPTTKEFTDFGLRIKMEVHNELTTASFCGMIFDLKDKTNITDPREVLATFGWTSYRYIRSKASVKMTLLRCKALSLAYQYPSCPVLSAFAERMLFLTRSYEVTRFVEKQGRFLYNQYDIEVFKDADRANKSGQLLFSEPGINTRLMMESLYGLTLDDQRYIETYVRQMVIEPITDPRIINLMPKCWVDYYERYYAKLSPDLESFEYPTNLWVHYRSKIDTGGLTIPGADHNA